VEFGSFQSSDAQKLMSATIYNDSGAVLTGPATLSSEDFSFVSGFNCAAGAKNKSSCSAIKLVFSPQGKTPGEYSATLNLGSISVPLHATIAEPVVPSPEDLALGISSSLGDNIDFGSQISSGSTVIKTITLTNNSGQILTAAMDTSNLGNFSLSYDACSNKALSKKGTCQIKVSLVPTGLSGTQSGSLSYSGHVLSLTAEVVSPQTVADSGEPAVVNGVTYAPQVQFLNANQAISEYQFSGASNLALTIKNSGNLATAVSAPIISDLVNFSVVQNTCENKALGPNNSCALRIAFSASGKAGGLYQTSVTFAGATLNISAVADDGIACESGEHKELGTCQSDSKSCTVAGADSALMTWNGAMYGPCVPQVCNEATSHKDLINNKCVAPSINCYGVNNATLVTRTYEDNLGDYGACIVQTCGSGYKVSPDTYSCVADSFTISFRNGSNSADGSVDVVASDGTNLNTGNLVSSNSSNITIQAGSTLTLTPRPNFGSLLMQISSGPGSYSYLSYTGLDSNGSGPAVTLSSNYAGIYMGWNSIFQNSTISAIAKDANGNMYLAGSITNANYQGYSSISPGNIIKIKPDGSVDRTFNGNGTSVGPGFNGTVNTMVLGPDGYLYVGGNFTKYSTLSDSTNNNANYIAKLDLNGNLMKLGSSNSATGNGVNGAVYSIVFNGPNTMWLGGNFTQSYFPNAFGLASTATNNARYVAKFTSTLVIGFVPTAWVQTKINPNDKIDGSTTVGNGLTGMVRQILIDSAGEVWLTGAFDQSYIGGSGSYQNYIGLMRLNSSGVPTRINLGDSDGNNGLYGGQGFSLVEDDAHNIWVGGTFSQTNIGGVSQYPQYLAKLVPNGGYYDLGLINAGDDLSNWNGNGIGSYVRALNKDSDGNLWVGGDFTSTKLGGVSQSGNHLVKINPTTGVLVPINANDTFTGSNTNGISSSTVSSIFNDGLGNMYVGASGQSSFYNGSSTYYYNSILKLEISSGTLK
jgi:hypothetical protein